MIDTTRIESIADATDYSLLEFRQNIFRDDLKIDADLISTSNNHQWWITNFNEDAYKYSDRKWFAVGFDVIETAWDDNKIVSMSGAKLYDYSNGIKMLRVNMFYYILKQYRKKYNGIVYIDNGFFDRHIQYANSIGCSGMFFTIYPHSPKLKAMVKNHTTRRISHVKSKLKYWDDIKHVGSHMFNNVEQEFFYFPLTENTFDPAKLCMNI